MDFQKIGFENYFMKQVVPGGDFLMNSSYDSMQKEPQDCAFKTFLQNNLSEPYSQ